MYNRFYNLKENPFNLTADPDFFFSSPSHCDAFSNLLFGIEERKGILVITGEVGTGKTTLCRMLLRQFDDTIKYALILNPNLSEVEFLQTVLHDLGIISNEKNKIGLMDQLNEFLIKESSAGHNVVLIIDEAQNLSVHQLEQIRLLSNLETEKQKLLQIILFGQPELNTKLQLTSMRQLTQRVAVHFHLEPLKKEDVKSYISHRISKAYAFETRPIWFTDSAVDKIYSLTNGSPRIINILCDRALLAGFVSETFSIDHEIIESCAKEVLYCEHNL